MSFKVSKKIINITKNIAIKSQDDRKQIFQNLAKIMLNSISNTAHVIGTGAATFFNLCSKAPKLKHLSYNG